MENYINKKEKYLSFVVDSLEDPCYISDVDTYRLLFINKTLQDLLACELSDVLGGKCYEILQNKTEPCSFCTNAKLKENQFYRWEHYNEHLKKYYDVKDTLVVDDGQKLRIEIATDITSQKEKYVELEAQITVEQLLVKCASTLSKGDDIEYSINEILIIVGAFYRASRAYIFEVDQLAQHTNNTHEWCAEGIEPQIEALQKIPLSMVTDLMGKLESVGAYCIDSLADDLDTNSTDYKILEMQDIKSLLIVPFVENDKIVGFLGVDDPEINKTNLQVLTMVAMFVQDDFKKMKTAQRLDFLSNRDTLTDLYNRNYFNTILAKLKESDLESIGVVYVDINGLKIVNNKYGHYFGDTYIINCAQILKEFFEDNIFRVSGDEFIVLLPGVAYDEFEEKVARLETKLRKTKQVSVSVGSSWCNNPAEIEQNIIAADALMIKGKENHYRKIDDCEQFFQQTSEELLSNEIKNSNFEVLFQPKVHIDTRKISGAEALVRKKDDSGNYIAPNLFISRYETQGIIHLIDLFVLREVCEMLSTAKNSGMETLPHISINFSRVTLLFPDINIIARQICGEYGIKPDMLTIEVTEDCGFVESVAIVHAIERLKKEGFRISLDDFGCKYSNIEILSSISFDEVKLDKSLLYNNSENNTVVSTSNTNVSKRIILEHLIEMFQAFTDISIVVEGIEGEDHLEVLKFNKGLIGQGYLFSKPLRKDLFWDFYNKNK